MRITKVARPLLALFGATMVSGVGSVWAQNGNWPQFRGPNRDLVSTETGLMKSWPADGPTLVWKATDLGKGFSTVSVAGGRIYTQGWKADKEYVLALDEATGNVLWTAPIGGTVNVGYPGSRAIPTVDGAMLYTESVEGDVVCLAANTGKEVWRVSLPQDFQGGRGGWGYAESPLVDGPAVICTPGGSTATLVKLDKLTGKVIWRGVVPEGDKAAYASPSAIVVGGVRQYVQLLSGGVVGIRAEDGKYMWRNNDSANGTANCSSPIYMNGYLFSSTGYNKGGCLLQLTSQDGMTSAKLIYHTDDLQSHHGGFLNVGDYIYGSSARNFMCLEAKTGKVVWSDQVIGKGSVMYADGHLYTRSEKGMVRLIEPTPDGGKCVGKLDQPEKSGDAKWPYPVVAGGRLYLRDQDNLFCYNVKG